MDRNDFNGVCNLMKKACGLLLILCLLISFCACGDASFPGIEGGDGANDKTTVQSKAAGPEATHAFNNLTGEYDLDKSAAGKRPVAVMVNNIKTAQSVQTGLNDADVIFESMVEGGVTRLMAVYSDISKAGQIGTVRSVRYTYVELAASLDALLVHCGSDDLYTTPYMKQLGFESFDLAKKSNAVQFREKNGKSFEHTLYTKGEMLETGMTKERMTVKEAKNKPLFQFNQYNKPEAAGTTSCIEAVVAMSHDATTTFRYDEAAKRYTRCPGGKEQKDYKTKEPVTTKNVILLYANVKDFDDNYHLKTILDSGEGVYISEGTRCAIRWKKGDANAPLTLTKADGSELKVNAGNSFICLVPNSQKSQVTFTGAEPQSTVSAAQ